MFFFSHFWAMIEGIEIERFRCFHHSKFEEFKQVNLIGGQNNLGKTSLLEAIGISLSSSLDVVSLFGPERGLNLNELFWKSGDSGYFSFQIEQSIFGVKMGTYRLEFIVDHGNVIEPDTTTYIGDASVISVTNRLAPAKLAEKLDIATRNGLEWQWLKGVKSIDPEIEILRTFSISGNHRIYARKVEEIKYFNISQMGDATNKILEIIAHITTNPNGFLLIDEIENGIHYTHHEDFWEMVFKLAREFGVQVFATTHSLEMIKAFNKVAMEKGLDETSQYMEMFRSARSAEIVAAALSHSALAYSIINRLPFRGEER